LRSTAQHSAAERRCCRVVWCVNDYEPRDFTHHTQGSAGLAAFSEGGQHTFEHRIDRVRIGGVPIFLGEFGASRWASGGGDYYVARIAACEARGIGWAAFRWPTQDAAYEQSDDMFNVLMGDGRDADPAINTLRTAWPKNVMRPGSVGLRGRN
jgi:hypothetical protein